MVAGGKNYAAIDASDYDWWYRQYEKATNKTIDWIRGMTINQQEKKGETDANYKSSTPEMLGDGGWEEQKLQTLHNGIDLAVGRFFFCDPRSKDTEPSDIPPLHPLRVVAWIFVQAPIHSTIRLYCYRLTDPYAMHLLIHHGRNKKIQIILDSAVENVNYLQEFFNCHGYIYIKAFRDRLDVRVARNTSRYTSMHNNSIITDHYCTVGSYDLSLEARYQSWESLHVADMHTSQVQLFDRIWNSLGDDRTIQNLHPDLLTDKFD